jgi:hypothetical protein
MVVSRLKWGVCLSLILIAAGCGKTTPPTAGTEAPETEAADAGGPKTKKIIPIRRDVKTLDGNWVMVVTNRAPQAPQPKDRYLWIIGLTKDASDQFQATLVDIDKDDTLEPTVESVKVEDKSIRLRIKNKVTVIDFQGEFDGVAIRGTLSPSPQDVFPARMLPADASNLSDYASSAYPPAADVFMKAIAEMEKQKRPQPEVILKLAREHRTSPVSLDSTQVLLQITLHPQFGFDDEVVMKVIEQYIEVSKIWGTRMHAQAELGVAQQLVINSRLPKEAVKHLDAAEQAMGERLDLMKPRIQMFREEAQIQVALARSKSESAEERAAAYDELKENLKKQPFNSAILHALAEYAAANKQTDDAIHYYSLLVSIPMLEQFVLAKRAGLPAGDATPSDVLAQLWTERHGSIDGLKEALEKLYTETMAALRKDIREKAPPAPEEFGDHVVLVELFTGGQMPPAVATEIAVDTLVESFAPGRVVALRFHQHIPGPDGLVNEDSEARMAHYSQGRVPLVALNGAMLHPEQAPYSGYVQATGTAYSLLRAIVDPRLKQSTPVRIELSAKVENDELSLQATVTGVTEELMPTTRLRLALAEAAVEAPNPNGIRRHDMVVREMPGGAKGISAKKGELKYSLSMPAADLQRHVNEYITNFEHGRKIEIPVSLKPPIRNQLYLVAWVQNDKVDEEHPEIGSAVLQTAIIPVAGEFPVAAPVEPEKPAEATAPNDSQPTIPPPPALPKSGTEQPSE